MPLSQEDLWTLRGIVQKCGWGEFMSHVGSLMAEQADKVARDSVEDKALFQASVFIHCPEAVQMWKDCGFFDYLSRSLTPDEFRPILEKYRREA